jgi:hypothetical protein
MALTRKQVSDRVQAIWTRYHQNGGYITRTQATEAAGVSYTFSLLVEQAERFGYRLPEVWTTDQVQACEWFGELLLAGYGPDNQPTVAEAADTWDTSQSLATYRLGQIDRYFPGKMGWRRVNKQYTFMDRTPIPKPASDYFRATDEYTLKYIRKTIVRCNGKMEARYLIR